MTEIAYEPSDIVRRGALNRCGWRGTERGAALNDAFETVIFFSAAYQTCLQ